MNLVRMSGGASKEMWAFDVERGSQGIPMVLRINRTSPLPISIDLESEFRLMKAAFDNGIQVPKPYWFSREILEHPCAVLERVQGETIVRRLQRDDRYRRAREVITGQMGKSLAPIHLIPLQEGDLEYLPRRSRQGSPGLGELDFFEEIMRRYSPDPHPALELGLRWLRENLPKTERRTIVHGDYRLGNVIFSESGLVSILDWELAHIGDPMEDLAFIAIQAWRFGNDRLPIGGVGTREEYYQAYEEAGGVPVDREAVRYWEVYGNLKWAIITILQMSPFVDGSSSSIELASLGRKTAEVELQLISMMKGG